MQFTKKKAAAVIGAATIAVAGSGVAFAVWTDVTSPAPVAGAVGSNGDTLTLTTSDGAGHAAALPVALGDSVDVHVLAANVTQTTQKLSGMSYVLTAPGCTQGSTSATDFTITPHFPTFTNVTAGASGVDQGYYTVKLNNLAGNQDACQGSVLSFTVTGS